MALLQKMGWRPGEGLGKNKEGTLEPLQLEVKLDKKGLVSDQDIGAAKFGKGPKVHVPIIKTLEGNNGHNYSFYIVDIERGVTYICVFRQTPGISFGRILFEAQIRGANLRIVLRMRAGSQKEFHIQSNYEPVLIWFRIYIAVYRYEIMWFIVLLGQSQWFGI